MLKWLKSRLRQRTPRLTSVYRSLHSQWTGRRWIGKGMDAFREIHRQNVWNNDDSISGSGSSLHATQSLRAALPPLLGRLNIERMLDAPCGDYHWMAVTNIGELDYIGAELVPEIVESLVVKFANEKRHFMCLDMSVADLPKADLILCRDCLVHFSYEDIHRTLTNFRRSGARFIATTTYPNATFNVDCPTGHWRSLNLQLAPFNFPKPIEIIWDDVVTHRGKGDKNLAVWRIDSLPLTTQ